MGTQDKASNKLQDIKGKVKETAGKATGNEELETRHVEHHAALRDQEVS